jgi:steroid delta-isomerase-like uncharacterized protein
MSGWSRRTFVAAAGAAVALPLAALGSEVGAADVAKAYVDAWNAHDAEAVAAFLAAEAVYFDAARDNPVQGREAIATEVVASLMTAVPDLSWEMLGEPIAQGEMVAFQWRMSGTNSGDWWDGNSTSNQRFMLLGASVLRIAGGLIHSHADYYDALGLYRQLGWIEG